MGFFSKKPIITIFLLASVYFVNAQNFKSFQVIENEANFKSTMYVTDVVISPSLITIKRWGNGRKDDVVMKVDKIVTKLYFDRMCTWYYCTDTKKDDLDVDYRKSICIYSKYDKSLVYANFADEVTVFWNKLFLKE